MGAKGDQTFWVRNPNAIMRPTKLAGFRIRSRSEVSSCKFAAQDQFDLSTRAPSEIFAHENPRVSLFRSSIGAVRIEARSILRPHSKSVIASTLFCFHADEHNAHHEGAVGLNFEMRFRRRRGRALPGADGQNMFIWRSHPSRPNGELHAQPRCLKPIDREPSERRRCSRCGSCLACDLLAVIRSLQCSSRRTAIARHLLRH